MLDKLPTNLTRLFLMVTAVLLTGLVLTLPPQPLQAQGDGTPTPGLPVVTVPEPNLDPPFTGDTYPEGWLSIVGKSGYTVYAAPNVDQAAAATMTGVWQPAIPLSGLYQVSVYLGIGEWREFLALQPDVAASGVDLTQTASYRINHAQGTSTQIVDQAGRDSGWVDLGVFPFAAGTDGTITLNNQTAEAGDTAVLTFSALRLTMMTLPPPPTSGPTDTATLLPAPTITPLPPTVPPTATAVHAAATVEPLSLLNFGDPEVASSESGQRDEVNIPLIVGGEPVGRMTISYPAYLEPTQADNIKANIIVEDEFADALKVALEDETANEVLGELIVRSQFYLTLDAASFEFDETFKTQRLTVFQGQPAGVAWNVRPQTGVNGRQDFNIKVILRFTDGIPEVSGPPPTFSINVLGSAAPTPGPAGPIQPTAVPTPPAGGRIINNLIDNTAVLIGTCLTFIVGILGVTIAYLNYRRGKESTSPVDAPAILENERQVQLHRWLDDYFDDEELKTVCLEIGVDYVDLPGSGQSAKALELVRWCARNGRLDTLENTIREHRPNLPA